MWKILEFRTHLMIAAILDLICALINIVTLCHYRPAWDFYFMAWSTRYEIRKRGIYRP
jgi:hypothetical protein